MHVAGQLPLLFSVNYCGHAAVFRLSKNVWAQQLKIILPNGLVNKVVCYTKAVIGLWFFKIRHANQSTTLFCLTQQIAEETPEIFVEQFFVALCRYVACHWADGTKWSAIMTWGNIATCHSCFRSSHRWNLITFCCQSRHIELATFDNSLLSDQRLVQCGSICLIRHAYHWMLHIEFSAVKIRTWLDIRNVNAPTLEISFS